MVNTTFPVAGLVKGLDGTTLESGVEVSAYNATKGEELTNAYRSTTNALGEYTLDLGNLTTQWAVNDIIYLFARADHRHAVVRAKLTTGDANWNQNLFMKDFDLICNNDSSNQRQIGIQSYSIGLGNQKDVQIIDRKSDKLLLPVIQASANTPYTYLFGKPDIIANEGVWILLSARGTNINNQSAGVANVIGDTATNVTHFIRLHAN